MQAFPRRRCEHDDKAESIEDSRCGATVFACSSGTVYHVERGLGPAVPMDARSGEYRDGLPAPADHQSAPVDDKIRSSSRLSLKTTTLIGSVFPAIATLFVGT